MLTLNVLRVLILSQFFSTSALNMIRRAFFRLYPGVNMQQFFSFAKNLESRNITCMNCTKNISITSYRFSSKPVPKEGANTKKTERSKTPELIRITLIDADKNITVTTKPEAEKLAKARNFRLIQVTDPKLKTQRPTYQLMTDAEFLGARLKPRDIKDKETKTKSSYLKGEKCLAVSARISDHDLEMKLKKCIKWVKDLYEVRMVITGTKGSTDTTSLQESVFKNFESSMKGIGRIVQKRMQHGELRFQILPPKETKDIIKKEKELRRKVETKDGDQETSSESCQDQEQQHQ